MSKSKTIKEILNTLDLAEFKESIKNINYTPEDWEEGVKFPSSTYYKMDLTNPEHDLTISFVLSQSGDNDKELYCGIDVSTTYKIIEDDDGCIDDLEEAIEDWIKDNY
jgi:predicted transcriptional regulator